MDQDTTFVELDVHSASISVAVAEPGRGEVRALGTIPNTSDAVAKLVRRLGPASRLSLCYQAGPCGYGLQRQLTRLGATCIVAQNRATQDQRDGDQRYRGWRGEVRSDPLGQVA